MNLIFNNQISIFEDIFYKYLTPKQCTKLYTSNIILYNIYVDNNKFESNYFTPNNYHELELAVYTWCYNKDKAILLYGDIGHWNTINITNMRYLFWAKYDFNDDISDWNTSNVTNMRGMFYSAKEFNQSINNWNINNVENMSQMFLNAITFNKLNCSNWDISHVSFDKYYDKYYDNKN